MSNQVKDGKKSLKEIAKEMKEEKLNVEKLKKVQKIMKLIYKEVKEKFLKGEEYKILDFPENIFFDGENITFSEMKFPKLNFCGTEVYMDKNKKEHFQKQRGENKKKMKIKQQTDIIYLLGKLTYYLLNANDFYSMNTLIINTYPKAVQSFLTLTLRFHKMFVSLEELIYLDFFRKQFGHEEEKEIIEMTSKIQQTTIYNFNIKENEKGNEIEDNLNDIVFSSKFRNDINYSISIIPECVKNKLNKKEKENLFLDIDIHIINEWKKPFDKHVDDISKKYIGC